MRPVGRRVRWKRRVGEWLPRGLSLIWALWSLVTAAAYAHRVPPHLVGVNDAVNADLWVVWLCTAGLLIAGSMVPACAPPGAQNFARWLRIIGISLAVGFLIVWAVAFTVNGGRGWVAGKNYALMSVMGLYSAWTIARDQVSRKQVISA